MGKSVNDAGGYVVEVLGSKAGGPVAKADLDAWIKTYKVPVTALIDTPAGSGTKTLTFFGIRETCVIVDVHTMKIVKKVNGSVAGIGDSSIKQLIPQILTLLGK
ncbi:MAG: hypothetical protein ACXWUG_20565 [Polyangiales bacterium]